MNVRESFKLRKNNIPWISLVIGAAAAVVFLTDASGFLQYDRAAVADGQYWRIITGHLAHWSFDHLLWCSVTFVALGVVCEPLSRKGFLATIVVSGIIIPLAVWIGQPELSSYRGLSGIASAVFVFGASFMMRKAYLDRDRRGFWLSATAGSAYIGKIFFEFITGQTLFVRTQGLFSPVPLIHLAGGMVGLIVVLVCINTPQCLLLNHREQKPMM